MQVWLLKQELEAGQPREQVPTRRQGDGCRKGGGGREGEGQGRGVGRGGRHNQPGMDVALGER